MVRTAVGQIVNRNAYPRLTFFVRPVKEFLNLRPLACRSRVRLTSKCLSRRRRDRIKLVVGRARMNGNRPDHRARTRFQPSSVSGRHGQSSARHSHGRAVGERRCLLIPRPLAGRGSAATAGRDAWRELPERRIDVRDTVE